jgi:hypothetical protein
MVVMLQWPRLTAQPAQEGALEQLSIKPVCLGPPVLARDGNAGRVNDACLDATGAQPAGEPEAAAAGLESDSNARNRVPGPGGLVAPALQLPQQARLVHLELFERLALEAREDRCNEPTRLAHLDDCNQSSLGLAPGDASA